MIWKNRLIEDKRIKSNFENIKKFLINIDHTKFIYKFSKNNMLGIAHLQNNQYNLLTNNIKSFIGNILSEEEKTYGFNLNQTLELINIKTLYPNKVSEIKKIYKSIHENELNDFIILIYSFIVSRITRKSNIYFDILISLNNNECY